MWGSSLKLILLAGLSLSIVGARHLFAAQADRNEGVRATVKPGLVKKARLQSNKGIVGEVYAMELNYTVPNSKTSRGNLVVVFEPALGFFWWKLETLGQNRSASLPAADRLAFCVVDDKLIGIEPIGARLWVTVSREKYKTFESGLNNLMTRLEKDLPPSNRMNRSSWPTDTRAEVNLATALGRDFFRIKGSAAPLIAARITSASVSGSQCSVTLEGVNKDKADITLSGDYKILAATVNGVQAVPK